jgi:lipopolysaccharide/colanic/teichoic acid biosynthesis glycosyltransferase
VDVMLKDVSGKCPVIKGRCIWSKEEVPGRHYCAGIAAQTRALISRVFPHSVRDDGNDSIAFRVNHSAIRQVYEYLLTLVLCFFLLPLIILACFWIKLDSPGEILCRRLAAGRNGIGFVLYAFRSTLNNVSDERPTRTGRILCRFGLDRIPQLWNVVRGEMNLIGPRASLLCELAHYRASEQYRLSVKPGITGLWQVRGRPMQSFSEMARIDVFYIRHWSIWLDLCIALKTIPALCTGARYK